MDEWSQYVTCKDELKSAYLQRGDMLSEQLRAHSEAWMMNAHRAVTERREEAKTAENSFAREIAKLDGEILALEVELRFLERVLDRTERLVRSTARAEFSRTFVNL